VENIGVFRRSSDLMRQLRTELYASERSISQYKVVAAMMVI
jgi:hypothetical protein